jgi:hypothetical protein
MSFYIFRQNTLTKEEPMAIDGVPDTIDPLDWLKGKIITSPTTDESSLILDLSLESGDFRSAIIDGFLTLYHFRLCEVLTDFGVDNIQYFPVTLRDQDGVVVTENYRLVNIVGLLDCIDMDKSKVKHWKSGMGFDFLSMVIDEKKVQGFPIFRLKDDPTKVVINETLKQHIEKNKMTAGVKLIKTEDYSDW